MAKDKSGKSAVTRVDLRIPNQIFEQIEAIAIDTKQPKHHRTGKIITTPVILNLINLGLEAIKKEDFDLESIATKDALREVKIEKKITATLSQKLEGILSDKVNDIITNKLEDIFSDKVNDIIADKLEVIISDKVTGIMSAKVTEVMETSPHEEIVELESNITDYIQDTSSDNNEIEVKEDTTNESEINEIETEPKAEGINGAESALTSGNENSQTELPLTTDVPIDLTRVVLSYDDAVKKIKKLRNTGLSLQKISDRLTGYYQTKKGDTDWTFNKVNTIVKKLKS